MTMSHTKEELYRAMPNLKTHQERQMAALRKIQAEPVNWEEIDEQIAAAFSSHGQINPNKKD